jgi:hypothetical protein
MPIPWTEERTALLRKMFADGWSDEAIGLAVGCTAHAVIGKRNRLQLFRIPRNPTDAYSMAIRRYERERAASERLTAAQVDILRSE